MNGKYDDLLIPKSYEVFFDEVNDNLTEFNNDSLNDSVIKEAFENKSVDLREYAKQIENELNDIEETHILEYVKQSQSLIVINDEIKDCDSILSSMETTLTKFKMELGLINNEIRKLQNHSFSINTKLHNREKVQKELEKLITGIFVSPDLINHICDDKVDEQYVKNVIELNRIMKYVKEQPNKKLIHSLKDIGPELERLRLITSMKIRNFFLEKIKLLKSPNSNVPMIQKNSFLKYKDLYTFLLDRYKEVAIEIRLKYIYTIRSYYQYMFEKYTRHIVKLQVNRIEKNKK
ncbi:Vps52-domain-containing protein [Anaeromyces robustus]|uniref:Vps52-domain-containing protein n=1 Tax=Anaeromyces robustus TaxID=1754192 RepID=A0A1Y1WWT7_9FUNG|nr:Vps52-domain-containing protein [Anaeromyces robustus]|eukprot:ORX77990.1 Vps52-domain-containing protein [Anaeromyces robustus]